MRTTLTIIYFAKKVYLSSESRKLYTKRREEGEPLQFIFHDNTGMK